MNVQLLSQIKVKQKMLLLSALLLLWQNPISAERMVDHQNEIALIEVIQQISDQYQVFFNYDRDIVSNVKVDYAPSAEATIDEALTSVLAKTNLRYKMFNDRYIVIYQNDRTGIESLKEMIKHFQKIVDDKNAFHKKETTSLPKLETKWINNYLNSKKLNLSVSGKVIDHKGEPLIGVNVIVKGQNKGTSTDFNGQFTLTEVEENDVLVFSYIGYLTQEVPILGKTSIQVTLLENSQTLEEVVVVGYGTQKKVNLTGAVSTLNGDDLARRQVAQSSMLLQGVAPGVVVTQRNGQPGNDGGTISIRGKTTLGNTDPLVLVDGVERSINSIDPAMIESISVLKDAASAAIYGSRASAGVILVTTKRANTDRMSVSYNAYFGSQHPTDIPEIVDAIDHMLLTNEAYTNTGRSQLYSDEFIQEYRQNMASQPDLYPNTDWYDQVLTGDGRMQSHFLTLSGGSDKARISSSLGYLDQGGILSNTNYQRYSLRVNSDLKLANNLAAKLDAHIIQAKTVEPSRGTSSAIHWAGRIPANQGGQLSDNTWGEGWNGDNPIAFTQDGGLHTEEAPSVTLNLGLIYSPTDWLDLDVYYSPNYWQSNNSSFVKAIQTYSGDGSPSYLTPQRSSLNVNHYRTLTNNLRGTFTARKDFASHHFTLLGGFQREDYRNDYFTGRRENYAFPDYPVLSSGGDENQRTEGGASEWALQSFFGRLNYNFQEKYLLESNFRYDGSSRFVEGKRWGVFPSFSTGWRISEEPFFEGLKNKIDHLKLRASWGQLGNQRIGTYPFSSDVNLGLAYVFDEQIVNGAGITSLANTEISWETTTATNIGIDATLFNRFNIVAEYFYKVTDDILLNLNIPLIVGLSAPAQNAGKVENKGWEIGLNYANWDNEFKYEIGFNLSDVKNKVLDLKGINNTGLTVNHEGHPMFSIFGLEADGLIQASDYDAEGNYLGPKQYGSFGPGDIKYIDQNNDGVIDANDYKIIGGTIPRLTFGFNFDANYKNFDFSLFVQGVGKANGLLRQQGIMPFYLGGTVQEQHKDRWTPENTDATFPRFAFNETNNEQTSSFWMKNAAYARLKNIQLGYTIPRSVLENLKIQKLRFYVSGQNIWTLDNFWDGYDVEAPVGNGGYYPQVKTVSFGIDFKF